MHNFKLREIDPTDQYEVNNIIAQISKMENTIIFVEGTIGVGKSRFVSKLPKNVSIVPEPVAEFQWIIDQFYNGELSPKQVSQGIFEACHAAIDKMNDPDLLVVERLPETRDWIFSLRADEVNDSYTINDHPDLAQIWKNIVISYSKYDTIMVILLRGTISTIMENIEKRGRECEKNIDQRYVNAIDRRTIRMMHLIDNYVHTSKTMHSLLRL